MVSFDRGFEQLVKYIIPGGIFLFPFLLFLNSLKIESKIFSVVSCLKSGLLFILLATILGFILYQFWFLIFDSNFWFLKSGYESPESRKNLKYIETEIDDRNLDYDPYRRWSYWYQGWDNEIKSRVARLWMFYHSLRVSMTSSIFGIILLLIIFFSECSMDFSLFYTISKNSACLYLLILYVLFSTGFWIGGSQTKDRVDNLEKNITERNIENILRDIPNPWNYDLK